MRRWTSATAAKPLSIALWAAASGSPPTRIDTRVPSSGRARSIAPSVFRRGDDKGKCRKQACNTLGDVIGRQRGARDGDDAAAALHLAAVLAHELGQPQ